MAETGEGPQQIPLTDRQRANLRPRVAEVALTEIATTNERTRRARERNHLMDMDGALAEISESPSEMINKAREQLNDFGVTRDAQGDKHRTPHEHARFTAATNALERAANFLERGYERLSAAEQTQLVNLVQNIFQNHSVLGEDFRNRLNAAEQRAQIVSMLQDEKFVQLVTKQIDRVNDLTFTKESDIHEASMARAEAEGKQVVAVDTAARRGQAVGRTHRNLRALANPHNLNTLNPNQFQQAFDNARSSRNDARDEFNRVQAEYNKAVQDHIKNGGTQRSAGQDPNVMQALSDFNAARAARDDANREFNTVQRSFLQAQQPLHEDDTEVREQNLETRLEQQHSQLDDARIANRRAPHETTARRAEERELIEKRAREEEQFSRHLENAFSAASRQYLHDKVRQAVGTLEELEPGILTEEVAHVRKEMGEAIRTRYLTEVTRARGLFKRRATEQVVDRRQVEQDFRALLQGGPDGTIRNLLSTIQVRYPGTNITAPSIPLTGAQIQDLMRDKVFIDEMRTHFTKNIIANRVLIDQIRPAEVKQIMDAGWGKGMIKEALAQNTEFRNTVAELTESNDMDMDDPGFRGRLARSFVDHKGLWFTLGIGNMIHAFWKGISSDPNKDLAQQVRS